MAYDKSRNMQHVLQNKLYYMKYGCDARSSVCLSTPSTQWDASLHDAYLQSLFDHHTRFRREAPTAQQKRVIWL